MKKIVLHNTDLLVSNLCLGTSPFGNRMQEADAFLVLDAFLEAGGNFIDTANAYCRWVPGLTNCSEQVLAKWLKSRRAYGQVLIASKAAHYECSGGLNGQGRNRVNEVEIRQDLEESLATLGLDHFDLYWLHRDNPQMPIGEIIEIMEALVKEGKIRYYGLSNYTLDRLEAALGYAKDHDYQGFSAVSNQYSLAESNPDQHYNPDPTIVLCDAAEYRWHQQTKLPLVPFTSTARGFFSKLAEVQAPVKNGQLLIPAADLAIADNVKYPYLNEHNLRIYEALQALHEETGYSMQMLTLAYLTNQDFQIFPTFSVSRLSQLAEVLAASDICLTETQLQQLTI